jgi:hypothetical protein
MHKTRSFLAAIAGRWASLVAGFATPARIDELIGVECVLGMFDVIHGCAQFDIVTSWCSSPRVSDCSHSDNEDCCANQSQVSKLLGVEMHHPEPDAHRKTYN